MVPRNRSKEKSMSKKKPTKKTAAKKAAPKKSAAKGKPAKKKKAAKKSAKKPTAKKKAAKKKAPAKKATPAKKAAKKKTAKKAAEKKAPAKKKITLKNSEPKRDPVGDLCRLEDERLGVRINRKGVPADEIRAFESDLEVRTMRQIVTLKKRQQSRPEMMSRITLFVSKLEFGLDKQISVNIRLGENDEIQLSTEFKPAKNQNPTDGDALVMAAYVESGLDRFMDLDGTGLMAASKVRDHDFSEKDIRFD